MRKLTFAALFCVISTMASAQNLRVLNAASMASGPVAPGSIISIFGTNLAAGVAHADSAATPPDTLGGVSVTIAGSAVSLFYVSPTQINGVVDPATPEGTDALVVNSPGGVQNGSVVISKNAAPGLFSLFGTGTRDGAILNAITYLLGAFSTQTQNNHTYLALFATGLNTDVAPTVTVGGVAVTVTYYGPSPCCEGLQQINVMLPDSLAGSGRVPVVVSAGGLFSNTVEIVLLPPHSRAQFPDDEDNRSRSRELANLAYVPGTSLVLSTDENDDVVRVVDISARQVSQVIPLTQGSAPQGIAVSEDGTLAVVAESGTGKLAVIDLVHDEVVDEFDTGSGTVSAAIAGMKAIAVSEDTDTVTIIDLSTNTVLKSLPVGRAPRGVAADAVAGMAYVVNQNDGTISVINLASLTVAPDPIDLGASVRPRDIALVPGAGVAFITVPGAGSQGQVLLVNLSTGDVMNTLSANPAGTGGSGAAAVFGSKVYFANQCGGTVSVLPIDPTSGTPAGPIKTIPVDLGPRALTVDVADRLLVVSNEGTGTLVLISLDTDTVVGRIIAVRTNQPEDDDQDDHSDRGAGRRKPVLDTLSPASGTPGTTFDLSITGTNLNGAAGVLFIDSSRIHGNGNGFGERPQPDSAFTVTNIVVTGGGTELTATVSIAGDAAPGERLVRVMTSNGESTLRRSSANTFTVQ